MDPRPPGRSAFPRWGHSSRPVHRHCGRRFSAPGSVEPTGSGDPFQPTQLYPPGLSESPRPRVSLPGRVSPRRAGTKFSEPAARTPPRLPPALRGPHLGLERRLRRDCAVGLSALARVWVWTSPGRPTGPRGTLSGGVPDANPSPLRGWEAGTCWRPTSAPLWLRPRRLPFLCCSAASMLERKWRIIWSFTPRTRGQASPAPDPLQEHTYSRGFGFEKKEQKLAFFIFPPSLCRISLP